MVADRLSTAQCCFKHAGTIWRPNSRRSAPALQIPQLASPGKKPAPLAVATRFAAWATGHGFADLEFADLDLASLNFASLGFAAPGRDAVARAFPEDTWRIDSSAVRR